MMKLSVLFMALIVSGYSWALTNSDESTVQEVTVATSYARVKLNLMKDVEGCPNQEYYYLDLSNGMNNAMFSALLSAKVSQAPVIIQNNGCLYGYPWIGHVFIK